MLICSMVLNIFLIVKNKKNKRFTQIYKYAVKTYFHTNWKEYVKYIKFLS